MIIEKILNDYNNFDINLIDNNKVLSIYQTGDDINISCKYEDYQKISNISFNIPNNNEELYFIFDKLYTDIINANIFGEEINSNTIKSMEIEKSMSWYKSLVNDNIITVLSDSYPTDYPNILKIIKNNNEIILSFIKIDGKIPKPTYSIPINIRESGSRIYEFCIPFKTLFLQLQNIENHELKNHIKSR